MKKYSNKGAYLKFFIYAVVVVLINVVGVTLFFRSDLTANRIYSLSQASKQAVKTLSEPLTIKVFFTKNLPAPHNTTERYLHDLLGAYAAVGGTQFNYTFYDVTADDSGLTDQSDSNRKIAQDYGIYPVQIRVVENDEMKFQKAYMGLVIIYGDMMEKLPAITSTDGLEYHLTTSIQKLNNKVSAYMALKNKIKIRTYLSASLEKVAPLMGLDKLSLLPGKIETLIKKLNLESFNKIDYAFVDPKGEKALHDLAGRYNLMVMKWPKVPQQKIAAGSGGAGIVMEYQDQVKVIPLISSVNLPIIGTTYQMADPEKLENTISQSMETMIGINQNIGYLADHGTPPLSPAGMGMMQRQPRSNMNSFSTLLSQRYTIKPVSLKEKGIPEGLKALIIAKPTKKFSDYELFQIDQALMRGTNIAFFLDAFNETMPQQSMGMGGRPQYIPIDTGLEKLLTHYGITIKPAYVLDKSCYRQQLPQSRGGGEQNIYFAPIIKDASINHSLAFMKNIKGLITMQISPIQVDQDKVEQSGLTATRLFSSSKKSWTMADPIELNPMFLSPPTQASEMKAQDLAYLVSGNFTSYFAGKPLPAKPAAEKDLTSGKKTPSATDDSKGNTPTSTKANKTALAGKVKAQNAFITKGKSGKIFVMACSSVLQDNMLDPQGRSTNATFILNVIDHLNDQDDMAMLRSKNQTFNPLAETTPMIRSVIKLFNIAGLPILIIIAGFLVLLKRRGRKRKIKLMFQDK